jgi:hypothetical protein
MPSRGCITHIIVQECLDDVICAHFVTALHLCLGIHFCDLSKHKNKINEILISTNNAKGAELDSMSFSTLAEIYIVGRKMISGAYVSQKWCKSFQ